MERVRKLIKSKEPVKWLFYGDSITHGALHTFGSRDYVELFAERVRFELARTMDIVINTAISGNDTRQLLAGFDWRVKQFGPDVVFIMIGMNDCTDLNDITLDEFEHNLLTLCDRITALGGLPVLQTTCPILPGQAPDRAPYFDDHMDIVRQVAAQRNLPLIDHTAYWKERPDSFFYWMSNAFHPNEYGHRAFADLIYRTLGIHDETSRSCQLPIP
jgi:lysophospholipase L1-like esterase